MNEIFDKIAKAKESMSKSHKKLADYILENKTKVSFLNITTLANLSGTSEATIVRFCSALGYKGYPQFRQELQQALEQKITIHERLRLSKDIDSDKEAFIKQVIEDDAQHVKNILQNLDTDVFFAIIEAFLESKKICIVAGRSTMALARFMHYYFNLIFDDVCLVSTVDEASERYRYFGEDTVVFGITFARYTQSTIHIMEYAKEQNCTTVALTDSYTSPIVPCSTYALFAETEVASLFDTYVAPLSIINAMIAYLCHVKNEKVTQNIEEASKLWSTFHIFNE